jgi:LPS export ABC transporter protein LptC
MNRPPIEERKNGVDSKRIWSVAVAVILAVAIGLWLYQATHQPDGKGLLNRKESIAATDELIGITIKVPGSDRGRYWDLAVDKLVKQEERGRLIRIDGRYIVNKLSLYRLTADSGSMDWRTRGLEVNGNVVLQTNDGKKLTAAKLVWDPVRERVLATGAVILETEDVRLETDSLEADIKLEQTFFSGMTKVTYRR